MKKGAKKNEKSEKEVKKEEIRFMPLNFNDEKGIEAAYHAGTDSVLIRAHRGFDSATSVRMVGGTLAGTEVITHETYRLDRRAVRVLNSLFPKE